MDIRSSAWFCLRKIGQSQIDSPKAHRATSKSKDTARHKQLKMKSKDLLAVLKSVMEKFANVQEVISRCAHERSNFKIGPLFQAKFFYDQKYFYLHKILFFL